MLSLNFLKSFLLNALDPAPRTAHPSPAAANACGRTHPHRRCPLSIATLQNRTLLQQQQPQACVRVRIEGVCRLNLLAESQLRILPVQLQQGLPPPQQLLAGFCATMREAEPSPASLRLMAADRSGCCMVCRGSSLPASAIQILCTGRNIKGNLVSCGGCRSLDGLLQDSSSAADGLKGGEAAYLTPPAARRRVRRRARA